MRPSSQALQTDDRVVRLHPLTSPAPRADVGRLLALAIGATVALVAIQVAGQLLNAFAFDGRFHELDAEAEPAGWTWLFSSVSFAGGMLALAHGALFAARRIPFLVLGAGLVYFSLDDTMRIHERATDPLEPFFPSFASVLDAVLFLPVFFVVAGALWLVARAAPRLAVRPLLAGLCVLIASVAVDEGPVVATRRLAERGLSWPEEIRSALEEGAELCGVMLVATGLAVALLLALRRLDDAQD